MADSSLSLRQGAQNVPRFFAFRFSIAESFPTFYPFTSDFGKKFELFCVFGQWAGRAAKKAQPSADSCAFSLKIQTFS